MSDTPKEVPLVELLRHIPADYRAVILFQWSEDGRETGHRFIPVGKYMHKAADRISELERELAASRIAELEPAQTAQNAPAAESKPRFENVSCSQCGQEFGPGNSGFSHCKDHRGEGAER